MNEPIVAVVNPAAGSGQGPELARRLEAALAGRSFQSRLTTRAGEEERLAREAADSGAAVVVVIGGDGTWSNAANGILSSRHRPIVALIAAGTGNDFAKSVGAPARDIHATARLIESGSTHAVDVGLAGERAFLNCCGFGFDAAVLRRLERGKIVRGGGRYMLAALKELFAYSGIRVEVSPWPHVTGDGDTLLLVIANGRWYGGMFDIAPRAVVDDGLLDVVRVGNVRGLRRLALLAAVTRGRHVHATEVQTSRGTAFTARFQRPPLINIDGELRTSESAEIPIRVLSGALRVVARAAL